METKVVNVKVAYIRKDPNGPYQNLREWCEDPRNVYIGRAGIVFVPTEDGGKERYPKKSSLFSNPYKISKTESRKDVIKKYHKYLIKKIECGEITSEDLDSLRGKNLGCWCHPEMCHGNVLLEILELYE